MVRDLFDQVEGPGVGARVLPEAAEDLAQDGVVRLLQTSRILVETGQVELHDEFHAVKGIIFLHGP